MRGVLHVMKKELRTFLVSPIAYIVIAVFLVIVGWFFFNPFFLNKQLDLRDFFNLLPLTFSVAIPALTMRLFAEERSSGSYELLFTLPLSDVQIVLGKFFASTVFVGLMLLPTLSYPIFLSFMGSLDWGPVITAFIGALFLGAAFSAIGLFASSLTHNQIIALIIGIVICLSLTLVDKMVVFLPKAFTGFFFFIGAGAHFDNIAKGVLDSRDFLYFISIGFIMLYATRLVVEEKR